MGYYFDVFAFDWYENTSALSTLGAEVFLSLLALRISTEILYLWFAVYKALMEIRNFIKVKVDSDEKKAEIS